ncbi:apiosidase-like domain-containing protein, partial [Nocardioides sp. AN3]
MRPRIAVVIVAMLVAATVLLTSVQLGAGAGSASASVGSVAATAPDPPYFADRIGGTGKPVFIFSAEDWGILSLGGTADGSGDYNASYDHYFATRAAQGYNGVEVSMFSQTNLAGGHNGPDGDGVYPWGTSSLDPTQAPNATFWARRDHFVSQAAAKGFYVFLNASTAMLDQGA